MWRGTAPEHQITQHLHFWPRVMQNDWRSATSGVAQHDVGEGHALECDTNGRVWPRARNKQWRGHRRRVVGPRQCQRGFRWCLHQVHSLKGIGFQVEVFIFLRMLAPFRKGLQLIVKLISIVAQWQIMYQDNLRLIATLCETEPCSWSWSCRFCRIKYRRVWEFGDT